MAEQRRDQRGVRDAREGAQEVGESWGRSARPEEAVPGRTSWRRPAGPSSDGLVVGTSGNVSVRVGDTVLVTPSGVPYDRLTRTT